MSTETKYGLQATLDEPFEDSIKKVTQALKDEGFGILTEIDIQTTLKQKLDVDTSKYVILGACNPSLAHQALQDEQEIGLLLPCNVIIYEQVATATTNIAILDPTIMVEITGNPRLKAIADEAHTRLKRVIQNL
ncbi:MAG: DUF302 domain-containing protein [Phototrophicaceae bacterium]